MVVVKSLCELDVGTSGPFQVDPTLGSFQSMAKWHEGMTALALLLLISFTESLEIWRMYTEFDYSSLRSISNNVNSCDVSTNKAAR